MPTPQRKTDRRTLYTRQVIKDALLELLMELEDIEELDCDELDAPEWVIVMLWDFANL